MLSFSRSNRLICKQAIDSVFAGPVKISRKSIQLRCQPNHQSLARLAIIVSKKVVQQAALRNQYRRIIRESFRHHQETIKGLDLIVIVRSKCTLLDKKLFRNDVDNLWQLAANSFNRG